MGHALARVEDVAATVVHLLSGANRFISGTTIYVDGGRLGLNYTVSP